MGQWYQRRSTWGLFLVFNLVRKVMMNYLKKTTKYLMLRKDVLRWKLIKLTLMKVKLVVFSLLLNYLILIWEVKFPKRFLPKESFMPKSNNLFSNLLVF